MREYVVFSFTTSLKFGELITNVVAPFGGAGSGGGVRQIGINVAGATDIGYSPNIEKFLR